MKFKSLSSPSHAPPTSHKDVSIDANNPPPPPPSFTPPPTKIPLIVTLLNYFVYLKEKSIFKEVPTPTFYQFSTRCSQGLSPSSTKWISPSYHHLKMVFYPVKCRREIIGLPMLLSLKIAYVSTMKAVTAEVSAAFTEAIFSKTGKKSLPK